MSSNQYVNYAIGIVVGVVVGVATAGVGLSAYAAVAGMGAFAATSAYLNGKYATPKLGGGLGRPGNFGNANSGDSGRDAAADSLQVNSASESVAIPVAFGTVRVSGNHIGYDVSTFRNVPIIERVERSPEAVAYSIAQREYAKNPSKVEHAVDRQASKQQGGSSGGKGGAGGNSAPPPSQSYSGSDLTNAYTQILLEQANDGKRKLPKQYDEYVTGYQYYLSWELGFCMGPIDHLRTIRSYPGEFAVVDRRIAPAISGNDILLTGTGETQGGPIRFYRGTAGQTRTGGDPYAGTWRNYRGVAFAVFTDYYMGQRPSPESYVAELSRWPVCLLDDGTPVAGLETHGSTDSTHDAWLDANPAAILYEILTNKIWGRGLSSDMLDIPSFVAESQYFAANELGMSFTLEGQAMLGDAVDTIQKHVVAALVQVGPKIVLKCYLNRATAYTPRIRITSDSVKDADVTRPTWASTVNELRCTFVNRANNYQTELVQAQDTGNMAAVGRINSTKMDFPAFSSRTTAQLACNRLLGEMSFPAAVLTFKMNRFESRLEPGSFVEFVWKEWSEGPMTTYWRVTELNDDAQSDEGITVTLAEDIYMTAVEGIPDVFTPPIPGYEGSTPNTNTDNYLGEDLTGPYTGGSYAIAATELPLVLTDGLRLLAIFADQADGRTKEIKWLWREHGSGDDFALLGIVSPWAILGTLAADLPAGPEHQRGTTTDPLAMVLTLSNPAKRATLLEYCSDTPTDADHLDFTTGSETNWLHIGQEIFEVAQMEPHADADKVYATCYLRGMHGTPVTAHSAGATFAFTYEFIPAAHTLGYDQLPLTGTIDLQAIPTSIYGETGTPQETTLELTGWALQPFPVAWASAVTAGDDWTITARPRVHDRGSDSIGEFEMEMETKQGAMREGYEFYLMPLDVADDPLLASPVLVPFTLTPETVAGESVAEGLVEIEYSAPVGTVKILLYQSFHGVLGEPTTTAP